MKLLNILYKKPVIFYTLFILSLIFLGIFKVILIPFKAVLLLILLSFLFLMFISPSEIINNSINNGKGDVGK